MAGRRLEGKNAVVTGGASGIGAATVRMLAEEGARVFVLDVDGAKAAGLIEAVRAGGGRAEFVPVELTDEQSIERAAAAVAARVEALHALSNNAGIFRRSSIEQTHPDDWRLQVPINLLSAVQLTRAPSSASLRTVAAPIPDAPPVTTAFLPSIRRPAIRALLYRGVGPRPESTRRGPLHRGYGPGVEPRWRVDTCPAQSLSVR